MCNPVLLIGMAGAVVQGIGAVQGIQQQATNQRIQGDLAQRDANARREAGAYDAARAYERGRQLVGRQVATYSGAGISPATGTAREVIQSTGTDVALDIEASRYGTRQAVENSETAARVHRSNADSISASAPLAFISPILSATGTFLRGAYA